MKKDCGFQFLDHRADVYIMAYGKNLNESFECAAKAMFEVITDTSRVEPIIKKDITVNGFDLYSLLYSWLEELLYFFDTENMVFSHFFIHEISIINGDNYILNATIFGEKFDPLKHEKRTIVKAITYFQMEIKEEDGKFIVKFVLDI
ncbi:MAG: archease [Candidatus Methanomethylicia archaeon]|nr:archease [Candidatus Methanomethylicia archaeon]MCX8169271.1 archease [Candidatus Methanomethylicia archaeon]MDW7988947.1 archease [Nitrososphaerota archaeon]